MGENLPIAEAVAPQVIEELPAYNRQPIVRNASLRDVDALANIELTAFKDVYTNPTPEVVESVRQKYRERVELLGDLVSVLEDEHGVYGMMVSCTTDLGEEDFLNNDLDMTDNSVIREVYNPSGKSGYVVNLAVLPRKAGRKDSFYLFMDALAKGQTRGVDAVYFESRIPGFDAWRKARCEEAASSSLPEPDTDELAEVYWQTTRPNGKPLDPLMRMYADIGGRPLRLIKEAWKPDRSSSGYGVLFEYKIPEQETAQEVEKQEKPVTHELIADQIAEIHEEGSKQRAETVAAVSALNETVVLNDEPKGREWWRRTLDWAKTHKKQVALLGSAIVGIAYVTVTGGEQEIIRNVGEVAPWVIPAYGVSWLTYIAGGLMMAAGAGHKGFDRWRHKTDGVVSNSQLGNNLVKTGFWVNAAGGASAAVVAGAGIIGAVPPSPAMWSLLAIPAIDLYSTLASRSVVVRATSDRRRQPDMAA